jgi:dTDP-4-dehydrorhamnose 3,5-epimerase-like enzyme
VTTIDDCLLLELPRIPRPEGNITPVEPGRPVPFEIARVYYLYDIPAGVTRAGHAHRELEQMFVAVMGAFTVVLRDGRGGKAVELNRGHVGLYVPKLIWRELVNFSGGSICLVLTSLPYDEGDYVRDYADFEAIKAEQGRR